MTRARDLANLIGSGNFTTETLTATAGQTAFTPSNTFTSNFLQVFYNGLLLDPNVDYTENGTTITLTVPATAGDEMEVVTYNTFSVGDAITQTEADNRYVNASGDTIPNGLEIRSDTLSTAPIIASNGFDGDQFQIKQPNRGGHFGWQCSGTNSENYVVIDRQRSNEVLSIHGTQNHILRTNNIDRLTVDSGGRVLTPYRPVISVGHIGSSQALTGPVNVFQPSVSGLSVLYDTNVGGMLNESTGRFTVPVGGNYEVSFYTMKYGSGLSYYNIAANGYDFMRPYNDNNAAGWSTISATAVVYLNANDYITVVMQQRTAQYNAHGNQHLRFTIKHLG